jgi:hypothetical protein
MKSSSLGPAIAAMATADIEKLNKRIRARLHADSDGRINYGARAHATKGHVSR